MNFNEKINFKLEFTVALINFLTFILIWQICGDL